MITINFCRLLKRNNFLSIVLTCLFLPMFISAQVSSVKYLMKYNPMTSYQDCYIVIEAGSATTPIQRAQFNSQYSLVVPTGSEIEVVEVYMPLQNNQNYQGTTPLNWVIASTVNSPPITPNKDYYAIATTLSPTSFYNNLATGDSVKLFSIKTSPIFCNNEVRIFNNLTDPKSTDPGMNGGVFDNGFTIGGVQQVYSGNLWKLPFVAIIILSQARCTTI